MPAPLLETKFYIPPTRPEHIPRPHLIDRLNNGLHRKMTLISAPAGFGKTSLVSEWIAGCERPASWLSLDTGDSDPIRFLGYLIAALRTTQADIGRGTMCLLQSSQPPSTDTIVTQLINEIAAVTDNFILILDDYHAIDANLVDDTISFLVEHLPPQIHLVITTRVDPQLPLARLRASGQLTELRAADLRFSLSEIMEFLNEVLGLNLSAEDISALESRTEGWIAGLQLAALSLQGQKDASGFIRSFTGSHRLVMDYLIEEVLNQQSEEIQNFLLQTSVLDRLCGSLCEVLTGLTNSREILDMLDHANLFIVPLDNERRWYRYHHLFTDLLRQRLHQTQPGRVPTLHRRASAWYEQHGYPDEAIEQALYAEDFERAASLLEKQADIIWGRGEHSKLFHWLERLPNAILLSNPQLFIYIAFYQFVNGQQDAAAQSLLSAENALEKSVEVLTVTAPAMHERISDSTRRKIQGRIATIRAELAFYRGDIQGVHKYSQMALEYLPKQDLAWRSSATASLGDAYSLLGELEKACRVRREAVQLSIEGKNNYFRLGSIVKLASTLRQLGRLTQIAGIIEQESRFANESGMSQTDVYGCILVIWGEVLAEFNDLEGVIDLARRGVELAERGRDVRVIGWSYLLMMRILFSLGDLAGVEEIHQKMERINRELSVPPWIKDLITAWQTRVWLVRGNLGASSQWALERELKLDGEITYLRATEYVVFARLLIAQCRLDEAKELLYRLLETAEARGKKTRSIEIRLLQAITLQAGSDTDRAMAALERALELAEREGFVRIFVDEGPAMSRLLYEAAARGISPLYVSKLLAAFPAADSKEAERPRIQAANAKLFEPLSDRELDVLKLLAEGLTNEQIGTKLFISLHTVKAHNRNIFGKMNSHSRTETVAKARTFGILSST